jgi:hypothetical protein
MPKSKSKKVLKPVTHSNVLKNITKSKSLNKCKTECVKKYPLGSKFKKITDFYTEQMIQLKELCDEAGVKNLFESNDEKLLENALPILRNLFTKFKTDIQTLKQLVGMDVYGQRIKCVFTSCMSGEQMTQLKLMANLFAGMPPREIHIRVTLKLLSMTRLFLDLPSLMLKDIDEQTLQKLVVPKKGAAHLQQQCRIYGILILRILIKELLPSCFRVLFPLLLSDE